jgi:nicotinamide mononucleotide transporter
MKKTWSGLFTDWTILEKVLLFGGSFILLATAYFNHSSLLVTTASVTGLIVTLLLAKGKNFGQLLGLLAIGLYACVSFSQKYYGEVLISLIVMLPLRISSMLAWSHHYEQNSATVRIHHLAKREWIYVAIGSCFTGFSFYFLLQAFHANQVLISTLSALTSTLAAYLLVRRDKNNFLVSCANDIVRLLLWLVPILQGDLSLLPLTINRLIYLFNDGYGFYNWHKIEKKQIKLNTATD